MEVLEIKDRVYIIENPDNLGTIIDENGVNKILVKFDDGTQDWCKYEWLHKL